MSHQAGGNAARDDVSGDQEKEVQAQVQVLSRIGRAEVRYGTPAPR